MRIPFAAAFLLTIAVALPVSVAAQLPPECDGIDWGYNSSTGRCWGPQDGATCLGWEYNPEALANVCVLILAECLYIVGDLCTPVPTPLGYLFSPGLEGLPLYIEVLCNQDAPLTCFCTPIPVTFSPFVAIVCVIVPQ